MTKTDDVEQLRHLVAKLTAHAIENVRLRKLLDGAPHLKSCPLHGVANPPIADRLHLCRCFYRQTVADNDGLPCACLFDGEDKSINRCLYHKERDDEIERLRKIINDAPHDFACASRSGFFLPTDDKPCDCWKSKVDDKEGES